MPSSVKSDRSKTTMPLKEACIAINQENGFCSIVALNEIQDGTEYYFDLAEITNNPESFIDKLAHLNRKPFFKPDLFFRCIDEFQKANSVYGG